MKFLMNMNIMKFIIFRQTNFDTISVNKEVNSKKTNKEKQMKKIFC